MLAAAPAPSGPRSVSPSVRKNISSSTLLNDPLPNPSRRPLTPSEKDNAAVSRHLRTKEVTSRYLSSYPSSSTTSTSYSSNTTTSSSSSSSSRRFPSPLPNNRPLTLAAKRSQSVDRTRPSTPQADPRHGVAASAEGSNAARALCTTTRSLSVSFQGESFFYQTSKAKTASPLPARKPTPDRRRPSTPLRNSTTHAAEQSENSRPSEFHQRWPAARSQHSSLSTKSLECPVEKSELLATVHLLRKSMPLEDGTGRASFDGTEISASTGMNSFSSGSNERTPELKVSQLFQVTSRGISVPSICWQESDSRLRQLSEPGTPLSSCGSRKSAVRKLASARKSMVDCPLSSPHSISSTLRGPVKPSTSSKLAGSPSRVMSSPSRARHTSASASSSPANLPTNAPSIISFAAEVRRTRKGESRIEEAHLLRLLHNRNLQWRCVNARIIAAMSIQRMDVEKNLCKSWITISEVLDSVTSKTFKLQFLSQYLKVATILSGQMVYLEDFSLLDKELASSLSGAIEALKASTLRLPVVGGARADLQEVKDAVGSAVDLMQAMAASISSILSKVYRTGTSVLELAEVAEREQSSLEQSGGLLSTITALHVKQCSLQSQLLQLRRNG